MTKNRNIPQWQKSVFDNAIDKTSCVKTKPISTSMIKKIDKDFFDQNYHTIKIKKFLNGKKVYLIIQLIKHLVSKQSQFQLQ